MKLSLYAPLLASISTAVSGLELEVCQDVNFQACQNWDNIQTGFCYNVRDGWNDAISSLRVLTDGWITDAVEAKALRLGMMQSTAISEFGRDGTMQLALLGAGKVKW